MLGCPLREQKLTAGWLPRHRHRSAYVSLVLDGGYQERGSKGRWTVEPGQLIAHSNFESHDNLVALSGSWVLNVPVIPFSALPPVFTVRDPDSLMRAMRRAEPLEPHLQSIEEVPAKQDDWPDLLAARLRREPTSIRSWAREVGFAAETVSRRFRAVFGISPAKYRLEIQTLRAIELIAKTSEPLVSIACVCGFADQSHLCRAVMATSGQTPKALRVNSVQDCKNSDRQDAVEQ